MPNDTTTVITLGRASDNKVVLNETNVSNHHARLVLDEDKMVLEDLGVDQRDVGGASRAQNRSRCCHERRYRVFRIEPIFSF